ncbi:hypothetical protein KQI52_03080 [bacterium]|nr:hypothetical protein [bacterium]
MKRSHLTELSLTLGNWGRAPLSVDAQQQVLRTLANWSAKTGMPVSAEVYARPEPQLAVIEEWCGGDNELTIIVREDPRSDRLARVAKTSAENVVIEVPVSPQTGIMRFRPKGLEMAPGYAAQAARTAVLQGLVPEIALIDIARAKKYDVLLVVDAVLEALRPHDGQVRWRLVDSTGWADPLAGSRLPRSLAAWVRLLVNEYAIPVDTISVQCADTLGFANANTVAGAKTGAGVVTSLLGLGMGCGWGATEVVLTHLLGDTANTKRLLGLQPVLFATDSEAISVPRLAGKSGLAAGHDYRDESRPVSCARAWQFPGGAAPEKPSDELLAAHFPVSPKTLSRHAPEPLLTALSGHAGLLHLMHRQWPERHFETEDDRAFALSQAFEEEFASGRQIPVSWRELLPKVEASGIVEDTPPDGTD